MPPLDLRPPANEFSRLGSAQILPTAPTARSLTMISTWQAPVLTAPESHKPCQKEDQAHYKFGLQLERRNAKWRMWASLRSNFSRTKMVYFLKLDCITRQHLPGRVRRAGETETRCQQLMQLPSLHHTLLGHTTHSFDALKGIHPMEHSHLCASGCRRRVQGLEASLE